MSRGRDTNDLREEENGRHSQSGLDERPSRSSSPPQLNDLMSDRERRNSSMAGKSNENENHVKSIRYDQTPAASLEIVLCFHTRTTFTADDECEQEKNES